MSSAKVKRASKRGSGLGPIRVGEEIEILTTQSGVARWVPTWWRPGQRSWFRIVEVIQTSSGKSLVLDNGKTVSLSQIMRGRRDNPADIVASRSGRNRVHEAIFIRHLDHREWLPDSIPISDLPPGPSPYRTLWRLEPPKDGDPQYVVITTSVDRKWMRDWDHLAIAFPAKASGEWAIDEIAERRGARVAEDLLEDMGYIPVRRAALDTYVVEREDNPRHRIMARRLARGL